MLQILPPIQNRVVIENTGLNPLIGVGTAEASGMSQLQPDQQRIVGARRPAVFFD